MKRQTANPSVNRMLNKLHIVFEDDSVIVVDKPAGLLTMGTETERSNTLYATLRAYLNSKQPAEKVFIVHRLDREASGLLVFAKTVEAKEQLKNQFKDHSAGRVYTAVAEGRVLPEQFTIKTLLAENAAFRVYSTPNPRTGKPAVTHVRVLKRSAKTSLLEVRLETGRKHQIRVHLAERGHPIVGDKVYGGRNNVLGRLGLHGTHLEFDHPRSKTRLKFDSPYPANWR
jgi:23S rRNA pseudouridine1911/1915/1917 synthase